MQYVSKNGVGFFVDETATPGNPGFWDLVEQNMWEENTFNIFSKFLDRDHSYVDVGTWIGPTVLYGAKFCKTAYAIEPDPVAFEILRRNLNSNNIITNVISDNCAIFENDGIVKMGNLSQVGNSMPSILFSNENEWEITCYKLETFFERHRIERCNFIKIDAEGGECFIIPASRDFFKSFDHILYLSLHVPYFKSENAMQLITDSLGSVYTHFYLENGNEWDMATIGKQTGFFSIVASKYKLSEFW